MQNGRSSEVYAITKIGGDLSLGTKSRIGATIGVETRHVMPQQKVFRKEMKIDSSFRCELPRVKSQRFRRQSNASDSVFACGRRQFNLDHLALAQELVWTLSQTKIRAFDE